MKGLLRKAGKAIQSFDDAYSEKVMDLARDKPGGVFVQMGAGLPVMHGVQPSTPQEISMDYARSGKAPASKQDVARHQRNEMLFGGALLATNVGTRYVLPAAGVTLAGKGLYDLTTQFGNEADYPESNQLTLR